MKTVIATVPVGGTFESEDDEHIGSDLSYALRPEKQGSGMLVYAMGGVGLLGHPRIYPRTSLQLPEFYPSVLVRSSGHSFLEPLIWTQACYE